MAKRIAFWTSIPWMGTLLPALWLAHGCGGSNLREAACATTPEMLSSPIAHIALLTTMAWILIGPIVMIVVGAIEWRAQR